MPRGEVDRLAGLNLLRPNDAGTSFPRTDIERVRLVRAIEVAGIPARRIARGMRRGLISWEIIDRMLPEPVELTDQSVSQLAVELGLEVEELQRGYAALGLPKPHPDDRVREDDRRLLSALLRTWREVGEVASVFRLLRLLGDPARRSAEASVQFWNEVVLQPGLESGRWHDPDEAARIDEIGARFFGLALESMPWLYRRHAELALLNDWVSDAERVLTARSRRAARARENAIVFADMSGFTRLTEAGDDETAARVAERFAALTEDAATKHGGRLVKLLGDGAMLHLPDRAAAVRCALEVVAMAPTIGLPAVHVGIDAGPIVVRDADYFGRTVNVAARISAKARPGEVLVSEAVAACGAPDLAFEPIGTVSLKGVSSHMPLFRALIQ